MKARKSLTAAAAVFVLLATTGFDGCSRAESCAGFAGNVLNGKHGLANNPIHSKHGACVGPVGDQSSTNNQPNPQGPWDCFKAIGGWNCKKPGVEPTLFPSNPNG